MHKDWPGYFQATKNGPPRPLLVKALGYFKERNSALDLGAGAMNESRYLFEQGFSKVVAVDSEPKFFEFCEKLKSHNLTCIVSTFDKFNFPKEEYDLVNAQFALPFNPPETFGEVFSRIRESIRKGGIFAGQLFGIRDEWNKQGTGMTFHTKQEAEELFGEMDIIELEEVEKDDKTALGPAKKWHIFHVIARKR